MRYLGLLGLFLFFIACGDDSDPSDAGGVDAIGTDAAMADAAGDVGADAVDGSDAGASDAASDAPPPGDGGATERFSIDGLRYVGAFRISSDDFGGSNTNYAVGTLGYNPENASLFIAGHAQHNMVAEFPIPDSFGMGDVVADLPLVETPLQAFAPLLDETPDGNPDGMDRITGLYWFEGDLIVNANRWYDASGQARDTTLVVRDADLRGTIDGFYEMGGAAQGAGFMGPVPAEWRGAIGEALSGWASNYSIVSRYSVGPSLFGFDPSAIPAAGGAIATTTHLSYPYSDGVYLADDALEYQCEEADGVTTCEDGAQASDLWNITSKAMYGFIVPGTRTYALFGNSSGMDTGLGYKIHQDDGNLCGGPCSRGAADTSNYYWFYDLDEILAAASPSDPRPYAYARWSLPFDDDGQHAIIGGAFAPDTGTLYLSISDAGQVGDFDRPPLILAFAVE